MENFTRGKASAVLEEQSLAKNPNQSNPLSHMYPPLPPLNVCSSFQESPIPYYFSHGDCNSGPKSHPQFANTYSHPSQDGNQNTQNPSLPPVRMNPINVAGGTSAGDDIRRLKRESAKKCRLRKVQLVTDLKSQAEKLKAQIASFQPQILACTKQNKLLMQEQCSLKQEVAELEKNNKIKEAETENNLAEVRKLKELYKKQEEQSQALAEMLAERDGQQLMYNYSNLNYSGGDQGAYTNPNQVRKNISCH